MGKSGVVKVRIDGRADYVPRDLPWERSFRIEEDLGPVDIGEFRKPEGNDAWPFPWGANETRGGRVGDRICHLLEDIVLRSERDDAGLLGRPQVFPATQPGVLRTREESVKALQELRQAGLGISNHSVPMVGHDAHGVNQNAGKPGCVGKAVANQLIGTPGWLQQELPLRTAPRH
jgi:hypothetical protein